MLVALGLRARVSRGLDLRFGHHGLSPLANTPISLWQLSQQ
jgi:hypothetical protein